MAESLLRNRTILERLECLDEEGMTKLRTGKAPIITKGPYKGELSTGDHIIPRAVCPELDNKLFNLEFLPETLNQQKAAKIGDRQKQLAKKWHKLGLLSEEGLETVVRADVDNGRELLFRPPLSGRLSVGEGGGAVTFQID